MITKKERERFGKPHDNWIPCGVCDKYEETLAEALILLVQAKVELTTALSKGAKETIKEINQFLFTVEGVSHAQD